MITVEDKIRTFSKYVYEKELKLSNEKIKEIEVQNEELLQTKQKEIELKCKELSDKMNRKIESECQKIISKAKMDAKENTLQIKKQLLGDFITEVISSLVSYTGSQAYEAYMNRLIDEAKELLSSADIIVYFVEKDIPKFGSEFKNKYPGIEILPISNENIGGLIIESITTKQRMDFTLKRKVNEWNREIGLKLYEALEK